MSDLATTVHGADTTTLCADTRQQPRGRRTDWVRDLTLTTVVVLLLVLSFVLGRASNDNAGVALSRAGQPASAGLSLQAERAAQARLFRANGPAITGATTSPITGSEVAGSGRNLLSLCRVAMPC